MHIYLKIKILNMLCVQEFKNNRGIAKCDEIGARISTVTLFLLAYCVQVFLSLNYVFLFYIHVYKLLI